MFAWTNYNAEFLKNIILAHDDSFETKEFIRMSEDDVDMLQAEMNRICVRPDRDFIRTYRRIIERDLILKYENQVKDICRVLKIPGRAYNMRQLNLQEEVLSDTLIRAYINAIYNIGGAHIPMNEYSRFKNTVRIDIKNTEVPNVPLYDFQKDAVKRLKQHFIDEDNKSGLLVMPTGSGKSRTASYFLIKEMISRGYQILWIAHRHMLIDQAATCFDDYAGLCKEVKQDTKRYNISCISGEHLNLKQAEKSEVLIASIQSLYRNKPALKVLLKRKVMIVVDEAHHTYAPSYREVISYVVKSRKNTKLLGLTATPVRANEDASRALMKLFDNNIVYKISMSELIAREILSDPNIVSVDTGEEFESGITESEAELIRRYEELPESVVKRIAESKPRNRVIMKQYLEHKEEYGKTLIFALNVIHCRLLKEDLEKAGVKVGAVYSGNESNTETINNFKAGRIDVLVNVNIMTEGTDVPDIETVFLTRPTQSEGLLMQMVGRGMRGKAAGGTDKVNLVDFHDKWEVFNKWLNLKFVLGKEDEEYEEKREYKRRVLKRYSWKLCREIYGQCTLKDGKFTTKVLMPAGWYTVRNGDEEVRILIFDDQLTGIQDMFNDIEYWIHNENITAEKNLHKYFNYDCYKLLKEDMELLMEEARRRGSVLDFHHLQNRDEINPYKVLEEAEKNKIDPYGLASDIYNSHKEAADIYGTHLNYLKAVYNAKKYMNTEDEEIKIKEMPLELIPFKPGPYHNLEERTKAVIDKMFDGDGEGRDNVQWTDKNYKEFYGCYRESDGRVWINKVLDSESVPKEVIEYLIYHEFLHRYYRYHDPKFRELEHRFDGYEKWDNFLDARMHRFDIKNWRE